MKIGLDNPLTGTYAAPGKNDLVGCQLALEQITEERVRALAGASVERCQAIG